METLHSPVTPPPPIPQHSTPTTQRPTTAPASAPPSPVPASLLNSTPPATLKHTPPTTPRLATALASAPATPPAQHRRDQLEVDSTEKHPSHTVTRQRWVDRSPQSVWEDVEWDDEYQDWKTPASPSVLLTASPLRDGVPTPEMQDREIIAPAGAGLEPRVKHKSVLCWYHTRRGFVVRVRSAPSRMAGRVADSFCTFGPHSLASISGQKTSRSANVEPRTQDPLA